MIPQQTSPLTKFIRTLEGWVVVAVNGTLIIVPIVTSSLTATTAVKYGAIFNGVVVASRSILKAVASLSPMIGPPITPKGIGSRGDTATTQEASTPDNLEEGPSEEDLQGWADVDASKLTEIGEPQDKVQAAGAPDEISEAKS